MSVETLRKLGFTEYEAKLLSALLQKQAWLTADELASETRVPLTKTYSILLSLEKKGLIRMTPKKPRRYFTTKEEFLKVLKKVKEEELKEESKKQRELIEKLRKELPKIRKFEEVEVRYFTNPEKYWQNYVREVLRFKRGDIYRVINTVRLTFGLLDEEIKHIPSLREYAGKEPALIKGATLHYILNPRAIVKRTKQELKSPRKVKRSLNQMLQRMYKFRKRIKIDISYAFENLLVAILPRCVCLEFYTTSSTEISSAIMIFSKSVVHDFSSWFDNLCKRKHNPDEDWKNFKKEIEKEAKKLLKR